MKKFYSLILGLACAISASAATPQLLKSDGTVIANGGTATVTELEAALKLPTGTKYQFNSGLYVKGETKGNMTIYCVIGETSASAGTNMGAQLCVGGGCNVPDGSILSKDFEYSTANEAVDLALHYVDSKFQTTEPTVSISMTVSAYYTATPNEKTTINLVMSNAEGAGVNNVINNANAVSFANNILSYSVDSASSIQVYDLTGKLVRNVKVSGNGELNLNGLNAGLYIYRMGEKTAKILVK
jgi:hypothetical protein